MDAKMTYFADKLSSLEDKISVIIQDIINAQIYPIEIGFYKYFFSNAALLATVWLCIFILYKIYTHYNHTIDTLKGPPTNDTLLDREEKENAMRKWKLRYGEAGVLYAISNML